MSNELTRFKNNTPPDEYVYLWWDEQEQQWRVWFADPFGTDDLQFPMYADGEFTPLRATFHRFKRVPE